MAIISRLDFNSSTTRDTGTKGYQWTTRGTAPTIETVGGYNAMHCVDGGIYCSNTAFPALTNSSSWTIELWFYRPTGVRQSHGERGGVQESILSKYYYGDGFQPRMEFCIAYADQCHFGDGSLNVAFTIAQNEWHHFAMCNNGSSLTVYLDGKKIRDGLKPQANFLNHSHCPFSIACDPGDYDFGDAVYRGYIAGFNIEDRVKYFKDFEKLAPRDYEGGGRSNEL